MSGLDWAVATGAGGDRLREMSFIDLLVAALAVARPWSPL
jgi:hypothetical protein